jgi:hypothetical protein
LEATTTFQCYICAASFCSECDPLNSLTCTKCATGALFDNLTNTCKCTDGYYQNGTTCVKCPVQCQTCSNLGICIKCADPTHRDISNKCSCIAGFFDSNQTSCDTCSQVCKTCTNKTSCLTCDSAANRNLTGNICVCNNGYYELYYPNLTRVCLKCSVECKTCSVSPTTCLSCDESKNRIRGYDSNNHETCICKAGFYTISDGTCVQSDCTLPT